MGLEETVTDLVSEVGIIKGMLNNGINQRLDLLLEYRENDKNEAIKNRAEDRELIMLAIKNQVKSCPNTFSLRSLSGKLKSHIKKHKNEKSNKKGWLKFIIPTIISAGALIVAIVI